MTLKFDMTLFDEIQSNIIKDCIAAGFDPSGFAKPEIDGFKMQLAYHTLRNGNDLSSYLQNYTHEQLEQIRAGLRSKIDVNQYADPTLAAENMHHKRMILEFAIGKGKSDGK